MTVKNRTIANYRPAPSKEPAGEPLLTLVNDPCAEDSDYLNVLSDGCDLQVWRKFVLQLRTLLNQSLPDVQIRDGWAWKDSETLRFCQIKRGKHAASSMPRDAQKLPLFFTLNGFKWQPNARLVVLAKHLLGCTKPLQQSALGGETEEGLKMLEDDATMLKKRALEILHRENQKRDPKTKSLNASKLAKLERELNSQRTSKTKLLSELSRLTSFRRGVAEALENSASTMLSLFHSLPRHEIVRIGLVQMRNLGYQQAILELLEDEELVNKLYTALKKERHAGQGTVDIEAAWTQLNDVDKAPTPMRILRHMVNAGTAVALPDAQKAPAKVRLTNERGSGFRSVSTAERVP